LGVRIHSVPGVGDGQQHVGARLQGLSVDVLLVHLGMRGFQGKLASLRHGVAGVDHQVHDDLLDLRGIGFHRARLRREHRFQLNVFADQALEHRIHRGDDVVEVQDLQPLFVSAAEGEQLVGERRRAMPRLFDLIEIFLERVVEGDAVQRDFAPSDDDGQKVVEVMRDTAGQAAEDIHLLGQGEFLLKHLPLGDVVEEDQGRRLSLEREPFEGHFSPEGSSVRFFRLDFIVTAERFLADGLQECVLIDRVDEKVLDRAMQQLRSGESEHEPQQFVDIEDHAVAYADDGDRKGDGF